MMFLENVTKSFNDERFNIIGYFNKTAPAKQKNSGMIAKNFFSHNIIQFYMT